MEKVNLSSDYTNLSFERDVAISGFSWPQRNYNCSFCKREFKSAQALGGHMNVHRRDRAKSRLPPSWLNCPIANPNPNPNFSSSLAPYMACGSSLNSPFLGTNCFSSLTTTTTNNAAFIKHEEEEKVPLMAHSRSCDGLSPQRGGEMRKKMKMGIFGSGSKKLKGFDQQDEFRVLKKNDVCSSSSGALQLELNMGLFNQDVAKEDLDLELRLGYS